MTGHHDSGTAMPLAPVIKGEFDLDALLKIPLCEQTDPLRRPINLVLDEMNRIRKINGNVTTLASP